MKKLLLLFVVVLAFNLMPMKGLSCVYSARNMSEAYFLMEGDSGPVPYLIIPLGIKCSVCSTDLWRIRSITPDYTVYSCTNCGYAMTIYHD